MSAEPTVKTWSDEEQSAIVERARKCFRLVNEAEADQREREKEDLIFQTDQWSEQAKIERRGGMLNGIPTPARPMPQIDQLRHPIQLVFNAFIRSKLGVLLHPVSEKASKELAEVKQGLYRRIERDSNATEARAWALLRAIKAGRGWYRILTDWDEDGDDPWDQEIRIERILYQENVFMDPACERPDCSDARWCLYVSWMASEDFERLYPVQFEATKGPGAFSEATEPDWVRRNADGSRSYMVAEYWWKDIKTTKEIGPKGRERTRDEVTVYCAKMNGQALLEDPYLWPGKYLPFVPVYGEELIPVPGEGKRRWQGMIRPAMDSQRAFNYGAATLLERAGMEPKSPYLVDPKQIEGFEAWWQQSNVRNFPTLPYHAIIDGQVVPPPARAQLDTTGMSIAQILIGMSKDFVQSSTAIFDAGLGKLPERRDSQSGRAIQALQSQGEAGTDQFMTKMADVSMRYEAMVIEDLLPAIYDREGRVTRILTGEDNTETVMLGAPFVKNPEGFPVPAPPGAVPGKDGVKQHLLGEGKYSISVSVGKSPQTAREAGEEFLTSVVTADPQAMGIIGDLVFKYRDEPASKETADRYERMIRQTKPFLFDQDANSPEQMKAQVGALQAQLQQLQQQAQEMGQALQTKQAEQQARVEVAKIQAEVDMQKANLEIQRDLQKAQMDNAARIEVARITAAQATFDTVTAAQEERLSTGLKIQAEMAKVGVEHAHEERMAQQQQGHEANMSVMDNPGEEAKEPEHHNEGAEGEK